MFSQLGLGVVFENRSSNSAFVFGLGEVCISVGIFRCSLVGSSHPAAVLLLMSAGF